ncbi:hypothetical protein GUJ93_ZPchr0008g12488 [Zizania palustris]|uniref:Uncharacterized protein n=1 Tax=Zizania palustris TaxID=103762 RepID=A0A8J5R725_ZIZPA|nr:hypothetical protein GUJ93_ZPchr0008g12488 [Zizania palustris]
MGGQSDVFTVRITFHFNSGMMVGMGSKDPAGGGNLPVLVHCLDLQVASFWALLDLRHAHDEKVRTTAFRCHHARQEGESFSIFHNTDHEEDTTIVHMARMMESMDDMYTLQERESRKEVEA